MQRVWGKTSCYSVAWMGVKHNECREMNTERWEAESCLGEGREGQQGYKINELYGGERSQSVFNLIVDLCTQTLGIGEETF